MTHLFQRYFDKHGEYPNVAVVSGVHRVTVTFCPGYVIISASPPYQAKVYVTRTAAIQLFKKAIPLLRAMAKNPAPDHDVPQAMQEAYFDEMAILREKREMKKARTFDSEAEQRRQRQHRRWLRAQARNADDATD